MNDSENTYHNILPGIEKKIHTKINKEPDIEKINNWKKLSNIKIKLIENIAEHLMIENNYIPTGKLDFNVKYIFTKLYYKARIFFFIDKY